MANNRSMQILRGSSQYDPKIADTEVLLDGQLFYAKKTKQLYIGNGQSALSELSHITSFENLNTNEVLGTASLIDGEKNTVDGNIKNSDGTPLLSRSNNSLIIGSKNSLNSTSRSIIVGYNNQIDQDDLIGGSHNAIFGVSNEVCGSTGITIGNSNIVGDRLGNKTSYGKVNQVNNCIVAGRQNKVQNCAYGTAVFGDSNTVYSSNQSFICGQLNNTNGQQTVNVLGYNLTATSHNQTLTGYWNDLQDTAAVFAVGVGEKDGDNGQKNGKNAFSVSRTAVKINNPTSLHGKLDTDSEIISPAININLSSINFKSSANTIYEAYEEYESNGESTTKLKTSGIPSLMFPDIRAEFRLVGKTVCDNYALPPVKNGTINGFSGYNDFWNNSKAYTLQNRNEVAKLLTGQNLIRTKEDIDSGTAFHDITFGNVHKAYWESNIEQAPRNVIGMLNNLIDTIDKADEVAAGTAITKLSFDSANGNTIYSTTDTIHKANLVKCDTSKQDFAYSVPFIIDDTDSGDYKQFLYTGLTFSPGYGAIGNGKHVLTYEVPPGDSVKGFEIAVNRKDNTADAYATYKLGNDNTFCYLSSNNNTWVFGSSSSNGVSGADGVVHVGSLFIDGRKLVIY